MNRERKPRYAFHDQHIEKVLEGKYLHTNLEYVPSFQGNSSLIKKLCMNQFSDAKDYVRNHMSLAWSSCGSKLISATSYAIEEWKNYSPEYREMGYMCTRRHKDLNNITCAISAPEDKGCVFANYNEILIYDANEQQNPRSIAFCHTKAIFKLAFPNGCPNIVWSSGFDSTVREHDLREPPCGDECKKVILDLRRDKRNSLAYRPTCLFDILAFDASPISPHLMFIGGSDCFGRLYDRRNLNVGYRTNKKSLPVNYYCPKHLSMQSTVPKSPGKTTPEVVQVAFSPHEFEVLMSYTEEHIYVMNINHGGTNEELYSPDDFLKMMKFDGNRYESPILKNTERDIRIRDRVRNSLKVCTSIHEGIDILDAVLSLPGRPIGSGVICEWLCLRAVLLLERKWKNDVYMAIRDCDTARRISDGNYRPLYYLSKALLQLGRRTEALQFARAALPLNPPISKVMNWIKMFDPAGSTRQSEEYPSWIDGEILASSNKPSEGTNWCTDFKAVDMKQRFIGHLLDCENWSDAGFLGPTGEYVVSASEGDMIYIWEKRSGRLVRTLKDNEHTIGQRLKCHPFDFSLVTAHRGIQLWHPGPGGDEYLDDHDDLKEMIQNQLSLTMGSLIQ